MGKIFKICPENISYEEVVKAWDNCNNERLKLMEENRRNKYLYEIEKKENEKLKKRIDNKNIEILELKKELGQNTQKPQRVA